LKSFIGVKLLNILHVTNRCPKRVKALSAWRELQRMASVKHHFRVTIPFGENYMTIHKKFSLLLGSVFAMAFAAAVFAQVDVPRETKAIVYPLDENVIVRFRGTTRFPRMKGEAKVERTSKNGTEIELSVSKMPRPFELGAGYATYVLWAISPNGQIDNLGEIRRRGFFEFDSTIKVTTPLQNFALIVTAEPHFLVSRPSRAIMLENYTAYSRNGSPLTTSTSIQYFGNSSDYFNDARTPEIADVDYRRTPTSVLQAKQAVALARYSGADRDANEELTEAENLLKNAEAAFQAGRDEDYVDIAARKAISSAVKAEATANVRKEAREKRNEKLRQDAELRQAENKYSEALDDMDGLRTELSRETRARELAERDALNYSNQVKQLTSEVSRLRNELQNAKVQLATAEAGKKALEDERERDKKLQMVKANVPVLKKSLERFGTVQETETGLVLTVPENFWSGIRVSSFAASAETKLNWLSEVIESSPNYRILVESHTDDRGDPDELQTLTNERARAVADKLISLGVNATRLEVRGLGGTFPVAPNNTRANRAKNRRLEIKFVLDAS
jgi:outer membrane protein OmpA-like peptidoglycan-associated protein